MKSSVRQIVLCALLSALIPAGVCAVEIRRDEKFLWSSYMICFPLERNYRGFMDRPLDRTPADKTNSRVTDLMNGVNAGVDAFSVDLFIEDKYAFPAFQSLVNIIKARQLPIQISPMFDGMGHPGVTLDAVAAKVQAWFETFAKEPCVVRCEGKPVIFTFAAYALKPEQWRTLFGRLHAAGCDGYWIPEMGRILLGGQQADFKKAQPWLDLFPAGNVFRCVRPDRLRELAGMYRQIYPDGSRQWVGDVGIGYWRPETAVYTSQEGTRLFRETWKAIMESGINWVQQSTWNDFSENHQIMPSENYSTTFAELNRYLTAQWKGKAERLDAPRLYLSQQQEILTGEEAEFELLAMLRPGDVPASMELRVTDGAGATLKDFGAAPVSQSGLQSAEFRLPVKEIPAGRLIFPKARLHDSRGNAVLEIRGPYTMVYPGGYRPERNHSWLHTPAHRQVADVSCKIVLDGRESGSIAQADTKGRASLRVEAPVELADGEVLQDGALALSLRRDAPAVKLAPPVSWEGQLPLNRIGRLNWGACAVRAVTADGRVATSLPVWVERPPEADVTLGLWTFDADTATDILDSSPWLHDGRLGGRPRWKALMPQHVADAWGGKGLHFDGVDDQVVLEGPIVPPNAYTVECWIKPDVEPPQASTNQILFATASAAVVLSLGQDGRPGLVRRGSDQWFVVKGGKPVAPGQWQHLAATYDGATLRLYLNGLLAGEKAAPGEGRCGQVAVGYNPVTQAAFFRGCLDELRLSARALRPEEFGPHSPLKTTQR